MNRGFVSFAVAFLLLIIFFLTLLVIAAVENNLKIYAKEGLTLKLKNTTVNKVWQNDLSQGRRLSFSHSSQEKGGIKINRNVYALNSSYKKSLFGDGELIGVGKITDEFPIFNYSKLFKENDNCSFEEALLPDWVSLSALNSSKLCKLKETFVTKKVLHGNLQSEKILFVGGFSEDNILAAKGYIDLEIVIVGLPVLIVAAGDVRIKKLKALLDVIPSVTVISATGSVVIEEIEGFVRLYVIAWQDSYLPSNALLIKNSKTPELMSWLPWMIREDDLKIW